MRIAAAFSELGPTGFLSYAAARLFERLPGVEWVRYRLVAVPVAGMPAMPRGHEVRALDTAEIRANAALLDLPETAIAHRVGQGMTCLGAWRGRRLLGVNWVTASAFQEDEAPLRFVPAEGCAWDTGLYVRPEERGGRAFAALWAGTAAWLRSRGLGWSMSRITDNNLASWRSHLRMGGRPLGTVAALKIGSLALAWYGGVRRAPATLELPRPS